jgi:biotin synthase
VGNRVYFRGLLEFSNRCALSCLYCGIRRDNVAVARYTLSLEEIRQGARRVAERGWGSLVLQSGENTSPSNVDFICHAVRRIKEDTCSSRLPSGLGITLSTGVHSIDAYLQFFAAGAHRYLLRVETTDADLFARIHPAEQTLEERVQALRNLRAAGFLVGTGVMIGLPGQTHRMLARDILFFKDMEVDMVGMGPYQPHRDTPMAGLPIMSSEERLALSLRMIAVTRLVLKKVNIASTTALETLSPSGRELGIAFGANVAMPNVTPDSERRNYQLYDGKPCLDEAADASGMALHQKMESLGRIVGIDEWGDSRHSTDR